MLIRFTFWVSFTDNKSKDETCLLIVSVSCIWVGTGNGVDALSTSSTETSPWAFSSTCATSFTCGSPDTDTSDCCNNVCSCWTLEVTCVVDVDEDSIWLEWGSWLVL